MHCPLSVPHGNMDRDGRVSTMVTQLADLLRLKTVAVGLSQIGGPRATVIKRFGRFSMVV